MKRTIFTCLQKTVYVLFFVPLLILFSCKKNKKEQCTHTATESFFNGNKQDATDYFYDAQGLLSRSVYHHNSGDTRTDYRYSADSIVMDFGNQYSVYKLNTDGLAISSYTSWVVNPNQLRHEYNYIYDANKYLTGMREIFSQLYLGNTIRDTTYHTYTIFGGNLIRMSDTKGTDILFEYTTELAPDNMPELYFFPQRAGKFLGKRSVNLPAANKTISGTVTATYTYKHDNNGKLIERQITNTATGDKTVESYKYTCN